MGYFASEPSLPRLAGMPRCARSGSLAMKITSIQPIAIAVPLCKPMRMAGCTVERRDAAMVRLGALSGSFKFMKHAGIVRRLDVGRLALALRGEINLFGKSTKPVLPTPPRLRSRQCGEGSVGDGPDQEPSCGRPGLAPDNLRGRGRPWPGRSRTGRRSRRAPVGEAGHCLSASTK
jgi:hypothetical protein